MTLLCRDPSGNVIFDADNIATAGVCLGVFDIPSGTAFSQAFPGYTGSTIRVLDARGDPGWGYTVDTALGYPRVTSPAVTGTRYSVSVWAMTKPSLSTGIPGITATRSDQTSLVLSPGGTGLYYLGSAQVVGAVANSGSLTGNGAMGYYTLEFTSSVPIVPVLEVLQGFHTQLISVTKLSATVYRFEARRCAQSSNDSTGYPVLSAPRILCYGRKASPSGPPYFYVKRDNGELAWDLMAGSNSLLGALATPTFDATSTSQTITIGNAGETWGVVGPNGGFRQTGTVSGATWRMRRLDHMFNRTAGGDLISNEIPTESWLADSNESLSVRYAAPLFVTRHTGI